MKKKLLIAKFALHAMLRIVALSVLIYILSYGIWVFAKLRVDPDWAWVIKKGDAQELVRALYLIFSIMYICGHSFFRSQQVNYAESDAISDI